MITPPPRLQVRYRQDRLTSAEILFLPPSSMIRCSASQASHASVPLARIWPGSSTTADRWPMVAMVPLSLYPNGSVGRPTCSRLIWFAACRPCWIAGCATCGEGLLSTSPISPTANTRSWPTTRRSGSVRTRPPRPVGRPSLPTHSGAATPAARTSRLRGDQHLVRGYLLDLGAQRDLDAPVLKLPVRVIA